MYTTDCGYCERELFIFIPQSTDLLRFYLQFTDLYSLDLLVLFLELSKFILVLMI